MVTQKTLSRLANPARDPWAIASAVMNLGVLALLLTGNLVPAGMLAVVEGFVSIASGFAKRRCYTDRYQNQNILWNLGVMIGGLWLLAAEGPILIALLVGLHAAFIPAAFISGAVRASREPETVRLAKLWKMGWLRDEILGFGS